MMSESGLDNSDLSSDTSSPPSIPLVDFSSWTSSTSNPSDRLSTATELVEACRTSGFAYIKSHGISEELIGCAFDQSKNFFSLPFEERMKVKGRKPVGPQSGYSWPGAEKASRLITHRDGKDAPEDMMKMNEVFKVTDDGKDDDGQDKNIWFPEATVPGFRDVANKLYEEAWTTASKLLQAIALGLGEDDENALLRHHPREGHFLGFRHYPPLDLAEAKAQNIPRMSIHRDITPSITLLFQDDCGGLEVAKPGSDKEFTAVEPIEGTLVLNIGDLLMRWTNDNLRSTLHGVALPPKQSASSNMTRERFSIPFFVHPRSQAMIECLSSCIDEKNPPKYENISWQDYVKEVMKSFVGAK